MPHEVHSVLFYSKKDIFKNRKIFIFITLAIIFATANIIFVNGFIEGTISYDIDNTVESSIGHLNVYPKEDERFIDGLGIKEQKLKELKEVEAFSPRLSASGTLSNKELSFPVVILGLDPEKEGRVTRLLEKIISGASLNSNDIAVLVSSRLAEDLKLSAGDEATLAFETGNEREYEVKGIVRTGNLEFDSTTVIMPLSEANRQLGIDNKASVILVNIQDKEAADAYKPLLMQKLEVTNVKTWKEEIEFLLRFSEAWRSFAKVISAVGLIAAAVSVGIIIYINVIHKKRQIGIMKALGAKDSFVFKIFIMEAALFGIIGVSIGDVLGYLAIKYTEVYPFYDAVMQAWISARFDYYLLYNATLVSFSVTILSGVYPAIKASRINIIKAIWGE